RPCSSGEVIRTQTPNCIRIHPPQCSNHAGRWPPPHTRPSARLPISSAACAADQYLCAHLPPVVDALVSTDSSSPGVSRPPAAYRGVRTVGPWCPPAASSSRLSYDDVGTTISRSYNGPACGSPSILRLIFAWEIHSMPASPALFAYFGPETLMPVTSILATVA